MHRLILTSCLIFLSLTLASYPSRGANAETVIGRELYDSFQRQELERWDDIIHSDVTLYSPGYWGGKGLETIKNWGSEFVLSMDARVDLVDEFEVIDDNGNGRGFITIVLHWKHTKPFFGIPPTGREGTSVETFIYTVTDGMITRFGVADNTLDLSIYLWERGMPQAHNVRPEAIITGVTALERQAN